MSEWTGAWWQRRIRYRRWPHMKWSNGWHLWRKDDVEDGRRRWVCDRCGGVVLVWPIDAPSPLLHRGDQVVGEDTR
jgi:hypothetical protein